jgi:hypothetical protein
MKSSSIVRFLLLGVSLMLSGATPRAQDRSAAAQNADRFEIPRADEAARRWTDSSLRLVSQALDRTPQQMGGARRADRNGVVLLGDSITQDGVKISAPGFPA